MPSSTPNIKVEKLSSVDKLWSFSSPRAAIDNADVNSFLRSLTNYTPVIYANTIDHTIDITKKVKKSLIWKCDMWLRTSSSTVKSWNPFKKPDGVVSGDMV